MDIVIRLLTIEERIGLALMFESIEELHALCTPSIQAALLDPVKVHRINELLTQYRIPVVSSELDDVQKEALATGKKPEIKRPPIKLGYVGVLRAGQGQRLVELFNLGTLERHGASNQRPMIHVKLIVPEELGPELQQIHEEWFKTRISIPMECEHGNFWISPEFTQRGRNYQHYTAVQAISAMPFQQLSSTCEVGQGSGHLTSDLYCVRWREVLDELVRKRPDLSFVHFMLYHFLQPLHIQEIHKPQLKGKALGVRFKDQEYRVVGITLHGTLLLTKQLDQGLYYDTTLSFLDLAHTATWFEIEDNENTT